MKSLGLIVIIFIIVVIVLVFVSKKLKRLKIDNVFFISGGVKTGKSFLSVALAVKTYRKNLLKWYLTNWLYKLFKKGTCKPMLYSNIPLRNIRFNPLTLDIIKRKVRIPNRSVVLIDEISLLADSMLYKDKKINDELMIFIKLFGHYTHNGTLITNSQAIADCHFSIKRCLSHYLYINSRMKFPFITKFNVRELIYSDDGSANVQNNFDSDIEKSMLNLYYLNKYYRYYDSCCYSVFTDCLPFNVDYKVRILRRKDSLKAEKLITLQDFKTLDRRNYVKRLNALQKARESRIKNEKQ